MTQREKINSAVSQRRAGMSTLGLAIALALSLIACRDQMVEEPISISEMELAQATLQPFKEGLVEALVSSLAEGPENAIDVCSLRAPEIAAELSIDGIAMGRTSHKLRNPQNTPRPWVEPLLAAYIQDPSKKEPMAVALGEAGFGYVEPIHVKHFCLSCHGPSIEPALLETIRARYPEDEATGFKADDLRGLFWVELPRLQG